MKDIYTSFLFNHHILVNESTNPNPIELSESFSAVIALANRFGIRIHKNAHMASLNMIKICADNLGEFVPEPFYRRFPESVREMTPDRLLFDQMYHYCQTYGMGWFDTAGHSVLENTIIDEFDKKMIPERFEAKDFDILPLNEAKSELIRLLQNLCSGSRPLNPSQKELILSAYKDFGKIIIPDKMPCKKTVIELLYETKDAAAFIRFLKLPDTIKLLEHIQDVRYRSENLKKLNLKNQDRKFLAKVINVFFIRYAIRYGKHSEEDRDLIKECFEKKKIWSGLLHHIHYKPVNKYAEEFVHNIRSGGNCSAYSEFEAKMKANDVVSAAQYLCETKGTSTLIRNLNYILSRCKTEKEVEGVMACLK